jgi:hypothetical protein
MALKSLVNDDAVTFGVDPLELELELDAVDAAPDDDDVLVVLLDEPHAATARAATMAKTIATKPALLVRKCTVTTS